MTSAGCSVISCCGLSRSSPADGGCSAAACAASSCRAVEMSALGLYLRYASISLRGQLAYRASFVMQTAGHFLVTGLEFVGVWALFARFGQIAGWRLEEVA